MYFVSCYYDRLDIPLYNDYNLKYRLAQFLLGQTKHWTVYFTKIKSREIDLNISYSAKTVELLSI